VREEIDKLRQKIEELTRKGDFNKVAELQYGKLPELEKRLKDAQAQEERQGQGAKDGVGRPQLLRTQVGAEEIAEVVSRATGIPVSKLMQGERDKLLPWKTSCTSASWARTRPSWPWPRHPPLSRRPV
jgi:ATP-dependent Clp protease ATP-binding subunit ClpB